MTVTADDLRRLYPGETVVLDTGRRLVFDFRVDSRFFFEGDNHAWPYDELLHRGDRVETLSDSLCLYECAVCDEQFDRGEAIWGVDDLAFCSEKCKEDALA